MDLDSDCYFSNELNDVIRSEIIRMIYKLEIFIYVIKIVVTL